MNTALAMNTKAAPARTAKPSKGVSMEENKVSMLERAELYAKLADRKKNKNPLTPKEISEKYDEALPNVYRLVRLGNAPEGVRQMIRDGKIPATKVSEVIKANMDDKQITVVANRMVKLRTTKLHKLEAAGFKGGKSINLKRRISLALVDIQKRGLVVGKTRQRMVNALKEILEQNASVESIEKVIVNL
jgi:hypothetical protein